MGYGSEVTGILEFGKKELEEGNYWLREQGERERPVGEYVERNPVLNPETERK